MKRRPGKPVKKYKKKRPRKPQDYLQKITNKYKFISSDGTDWDCTFSSEDDSSLDGWYSV